MRCFQKVNTEPPLYNLLKEEEHHQLIIDVSTSIAFFFSNPFPVVMRDPLISLYSCARH